MEIKREVELREMVAGMAEKMNDQLLLGYMGKKSTEKEMHKMLNDCRMEVIKYNVMEVTDVLDDILTQIMPIKENVGLIKSIMKTRKQYEGRVS